MIVGYQWNLGDWSAPATSSIAAHKMMLLAFIFGALRPARMAIATASSGVAVLRS